MEVRLLAYTPEPEKMVAAAARLCYSADSGAEILENFSDEAVQKFLAKLADMGHASPFEHASFTFAIDGVSRALSHQLVRHRIGVSFSQKSQRYVKERQFEYVIPTSVERDPQRKAQFERVMTELQTQYEALLAAGKGEDLVYEGQTYKVDFDGESGDIYDASGSEVASLTTFVVRRYSGQDTLSIEFKDAAQDVINQMEDEGRTKGSFVFPIQQTDDESNPVFDEEGNPVMVDTEITVERKTNEYVLSCDQTTYLIDIYAGPSAEHWFGTDGDGMDILARMMYGGRISLMIGFVVVILETIIGVIMGGMAGFFGRWVDTLIMRLVDIFYCIPTYPILIIMGALFDALKMDPYVRLVWMMVALGVLGWAGIARLVRGQILSLREQEFMIAQEATGMRSSRRIFRHLVPNVMPQLIVNATMSLGSIIITEATLSFLGLGVKHPLATWGNMINSVTGSSESMLKYTYIWIPVGLLICLTVVAFNFVGDGLRDAFDPKMKQ